MTGVQTCALPIYRFNGASRAEVTEMHLAERWRDRLLENPRVLTEFADTFPGTDLTRMRTLMRNAAREQAENKPLRDYREIYRAIREAMAVRAVALVSGDPEQ